MAKTVLNFSKPGRDATVEWNGTMTLNGVKLPPSGVEYILIMGAKNPLLDSYSVAKTPAEAIKLYTAKLTAMQKGESVAGSGRESDPVRSAMMDWANRLAKKAWQKKTGKALKHMTKNELAAGVVAQLKTPEAKKAMAGFEAAYGVTPTEDNTVTPEPVADSTPKAANAA